jgi:hypothetical protein
MYHTIVHSKICCAVRLFGELPSVLDFVRSPSATLVGGPKLKKKIAVEIEEMRKMASVTATSDVGIFVSVSTPSSSQKARLETLPAGVALAADDSKSETGKCEVSEFGSAAALLGESVPMPECPGQFHPLRQNTMSKSTPRPDRRTRASGPTAFSNAELLENSTSAPTRLSRADSTAADPTRPGIERRTLRSNFESNREQVPVISNKIRDGLQPSALPQPKSGAADDFKANFSSFTPPPSARSSVYNSQRNVPDRQDYASTSARGSAYQEQSLKAQDNISLYLSALKPSTMPKSPVEDTEPSIGSLQPPALLNAEPESPTKDPGSETRRNKGDGLQPSALAQPSSGAAGGLKGKLPSFTPHPSDGGSVYSSTVPEIVKMLRY